MFLGQKLHAFGAEVHDVNILIEEGRVRAEWIRIENEMPSVRFHVRHADEGVRPFASASLGDLGKELARFTEMLEYRDAQRQIETAALCLRVPEFITQIQAVRLSAPFDRDRVDIVRDAIDTPLTCDIE